jgi:dihydrofolate synthase/folylpolyglutamate synthase
MTNQLEQRYQAALDYIYSFVDYSRTHHDQLTSDDFDLERMEEFVRRLGSPQLQYPTVHVAGSKGKGSVSALTASALQAAGYRVGLYTSPHLKDFEERMQVNGGSISRQELVDLLDEIRPVIESLEYPTTFEIMTALGFLHFSRKEVDLAVIEVGLGGRLDSTNVVSPAVTVITALYLDHVSILGDTIQEIAAEKGGIIKPGVPVIVAPQADPAAVQVLRRIALEQKAPFYLVSEEYFWQDLQTSLGGQRFLISPRSEDSPGQPLALEIPLLGEFQVDNALTAYAALEQLRKQGFEISDQAVFAGFQQVHWPGRFEILRQKPPVIVDSAHNPASCRLLLDTVEDFFPGTPVVAVFGISEDKQLEGMLDEILPRVETVITCQADHPRAMDARKLADQIQAKGKSARAVPEVGQALEMALETAGSRAAVLVAGSIFVAATARIAWEEKNLG